jgi:hypothetical protein
LHSLWAEDGPVFLEKAMTHDFLSALTTTWSEYLVVIQSLIGEMGAMGAPERRSGGDEPDRRPRRRFQRARHLVRQRRPYPQPYLRALLVALTVLVPVGSIEMVASPTNVSWYMAVAVFWLLLWRPATTLGASLSAGLILVACLSTPVVFFFVPIAFLRAVAIRDRHDALIVGTFALAAAVQLFAVSLVVLALRASSSRLVAAIAVATSVVMFLASSYQRGLGGMAWPVSAYNNLGARYTVVPTLLLIGAALTLIDARRGGPPWNDSLKAAAGSCEAKHLAEIPVYVAPAGWTMNISCDRLIAAEGGGRAP